MQTLEEARAAAMVCRACPLWETRKNVVFGVGNPESPLLFVGEGPGAQEDEQGVPFVGAAGRLLDKYLDAVDLDRTKVYIANIVKCRPPQNRDPKPEEEEACLPFLRAQVRAIRPRLLVCLGRIAAQKLISPDFRITRDRGRWVEKGGILMMGVFHPSALLRDPHKKGVTLDDFEEIKRQYDALTAPQQQENGGP